MDVALHCATYKSTGSDPSTSRRRSGSSPQTAQRRLRGRDPLAPAAAATCSRRAASPYAGTPMEIFLSLSLSLSLARSLSLSGCSTAQEEKCGAHPSALATCAVSASITYWRYILRRFVCSGSAAQVRRLRPSPLFGAATDRMKRQGAPTFTFWSKTSRNKKRK